jgi:hypothetical protein
MATEGKEKYQKFFKSALGKFNVKSPTELDDEKKKEFFNYIDKNYKAKNEDLVGESVIKLDELVPNMAVTNQAAYKKMLDKQIGNVKIKSALANKNNPKHKAAKSIMSKIRDKIKKALSKKKEEPKKEKSKKKSASADAQNAALYGGNLSFESTKEYGKTLDKMAKDRKLKNISKKDKELLMKIAQMMKTANEGKLSGKERKAILIAIGMSGNMTGAIKKIEKMSKGLSDNPKVADALRLANEGKVNEGLSRQQIKGMIQRAKKAGAKGHDIILSLSRDLSVSPDDIVSTLEKYRLVNMTEKIKEDLKPYKDFSVKGQNKKYDLNLGAFVGAYQDFIKFMKKHKEVPDGNKKEWALQIREKVGQSMFNGYIGLFTQPVEVLERFKKFEKLKNKDFHFSEGKSVTVNEAPKPEEPSAAKLAIKNFLGTALKKAGIKVKKHYDMKRGFTKAIYGCFYHVKSVDGTAVLPFYVWKNGKIELGVSADGFFLGKYGDMSKVVKNLKDFKKTDLDQSIK